MSICIFLYFLRNKNLHDPTNIWRAPLPLANSLMCLLCHIWQMALKPFNYSSCTLKRGVLLLIQSVSYRKSKRCLIDNTPNVLHENFLFYIFRFMQVHHSVENLSKVNHAWYKLCHFWHTFRFIQLRDNDTLNLRVCNHIALYIYM